MHVCQDLGLETLFRIFIKMLWEKKRGQCSYLKTACVVNPIRSSFKVLGIETYESMTHLASWILGLYVDSYKPLLPNFIELLVFLIAVALSNIVDNLCKED